MKSIHKVVVLLILTARGVAHLVVHGTSGSTSYETIPPGPPDSSGGVLSTVDMVVQRRDDDDDDVTLQLIRRFSTSTEFCHSHCNIGVGYRAIAGWLGSRVVSVLDSGAEGPGSNRSRDAVG